MLYELPKPMLPIGTEERYRQEVEREITEILNRDELPLRGRRFYEQRIEELRAERKAA